ncbi:MAG: LamG-like jellyroll fold domain-containing protein, partial [Pirellulales bacterium]
MALPADAVSWWTANNTASDALALNNATLYNATYATGEVGKAFSFNGSNGWAALGNPSSLAFTQSFTIEGWIKVNGLPTNYNFGSIMFRGDDRGGLDPYSLDLLPDGQLRFEVCSGSGTADLFASVPTGQFVHVAATLDDATGLMTLYEN